MGWNCPACGKPLMRELNMEAGVLKKKDEKKKELVLIYPKAAYCKSCGLLLPLRE